MTLGFSTHWPKPNHHVPTLFAAKILLPYRANIAEASPDLLPKIHTFRLGHRWRAGMSIQMVVGNRTPHRHQFNTDIPELQTCISTQDAVVGIDNDDDLFIIIGDFNKGFYLDAQELLLFAANDGFNSLEELRRWFFPKGHSPLRYYVAGQIVHWTGFRYLGNSKPADGRI